MMRSPGAWRRPHDWAEVVLGVLAVLSPLFFDTNNAAAMTLIILGALIVLDGLVSLAMPHITYGEGIQIVFGVLLFIAPWALGFTEFTGASWACWIIGALTVVVGAVAFPVATAAHDRMAGQH